MSLFVFPDEAVWDETADAVAFTVQVGEYEGRVLIPRRVLRSLLGHLPRPEEAVQLVHLDRAPFERAVERRITARALDPDANVHLTARDLAADRR